MSLSIYVNSKNKKGVVEERKGAKTEGLY